MKKIISGTIIALLLASMLMFGFNIQQGMALNPPETEWRKRYGGLNDDTPLSVIQTDDGGYALAGRTNSFGAGGFDFWLVKTDEDGNEMWNQPYGSGGTERAEGGAIQTSDGGYLIIGHEGVEPNRQMWVVKTDENGTMEWNRAYGGSNDDTGRDAVETDDEEYVIVGNTRSFGEGDFDYWLVKINSTGDLQWNYTYGGASTEIADCLVRTSDGGYAISGETSSFGAGYFDGYLVKVDSAGIMQWDKTYGTGDYESLYAIAQTDDGGYALAGQKGILSSAEDFWLVKTNETGDVEWSRTYGGSGREHALSMVLTDDEGYALVGFTESFGLGARDWWLVKTNSSGFMEWNQTYGGVSDDVATDLVQTFDGGFAVTGRTESFGAGKRDFWLIKLGPKPVHNIDTGIDYTTIQEAIDASETLNGHTISVDAGTYYEHVVVSKAISLIGENRTSTIIDGDGTGNVVTITVSNVELSNFTITGGGAYPSSGVFIDEGTSSSTITDNIVTSNDGHGIRCYKSTNNEVSENEIIENYYHGIVLEESSDHNTIQNNNVKSNIVGVKVTRSSNHNTISGNTMTDNGEEAVELDIDCNCNNISGNVIKNNRFAGIQIWRSSYNNISKNFIVNNSWQIFRYGIWFDHGSNYNNVFENTIANHTVGIEFSYGGSHNEIYHNNFIANTYQALPEAGDINIWDDGYRSGGNYWNDYTGVDEKSGPNQDQPGSDGIGDTPYVIDGNNRDNYPFMDLIPHADLLEGYIENVNDTIQDLPDELFDVPGEDVPDIKNDFSDLFNDAIENVNEGNYVLAIKKLNRIKQKVYKELVESADREVLISLIDDLIAYLEIL